MLVISEEQEKCIREEYISGANIKYLSNKYKLYHIRIISILNKFGIIYDNNFIKQSVKDNIIKDYNETKCSFRSLARKYKISQTTVSKILLYEKPLLDGFLRLEKAKWLKDNVSIIIDMYNSGMTSRCISRKIGIDKKSILNALHKNNVNFVPRSKRRKYELDDTIFEVIDTQEKAYWLGFLAGDGCNTGRGVSLGLKSADVDHLKKFQTFMKTNSPIGPANKTDKETGRIYYGNRIGIVSKKISNDLSSKGVVQRKSLIYQFPMWLDSNLYSSFILGLIDSDGCFYYTHGGIRSKHKSLHISFMGTQSSASNIAKIFCRECSINNITVVPVKNNFIFGLGGNLQLLRIVEFLYSKSPVFLLRKKIKAISLLSSRYPDNDWLKQQSNELSLIQ